MIINNVINIINNVMTIITISQYVITIIIIHIIILTYCYNSHHYGGNIISIMDIIIITIDLL